MKRTSLFFAIFLSLHFAYTQTANNFYIDEKGNELLLGKISKADLTQNTFNNWFSKNYDAYVENKKVIKLIKDSIANYQIKVFLGTWCGDSKREIPRFYKIIDQAKLPKGQLEVIAVDRKESAYKQSPNHEEKGLNIHRVPTFIFYKNGKEINRIVETPKETLEKDILNIITSKKYTPNYVVVSYLDHLLKTKSIEELKLEHSALTPKLSEFVKGSKELNTYGYSLLYANQIDEALFIFELNAKIFPYKTNVYASLGKAYFKNGNYTEALKNYYKVKSLQPDHEKAGEMIEKIKSLI